MEIIENKKWLRFVKVNDKYKVQVRKWWKWYDVTFGPFRPHTVGLSEYKNKSIALELFAKCLEEGKRYTLQGV